MGIKFEKIMDFLGFSTARPMDAEHQRKLYEAMAKSHNGVTGKSFDYDEAKEAWFFTSSAVVGEDAGAEEDVVGSEIELELGGIVVFSTDVTPQIFAEKKTQLIDIMQQKLERAISATHSALKTQKNRHWRRINTIEGVIKNISKRHDTDIGFSIGNMFTGDYYDKTQEHHFSERSMSIDVFGINSIMLKDIALELGKVFDQKQVLVYDRVVPRAYLVKTK